MFAHFLAFLALASFSASADTDTVISLPSGPAALVNFTGWPDSKSPQVTMNGHNNYNAAQQIFYIYGPAQFKNIPNSQKLTDYVDKVPTDYLVTPGIGAHKLHMRKLNWNRARRICNQEGGHLAVINSHSEELILLRMLDDNKAVNAWLGIHDLYEEGDWVTIFDQQLETTGFSRWSSKIPNLPDNAGGRQNCGILLKDGGGMDDIDCALLTHFFCEIAVN